MDTIRLYDADAYASEFEAEVLSCEKMEKKNQTIYAVILNQTLFFPEEGGQSADLGSLNGYEVTDVQIKKGCITHTLREPLIPGTRVKGKIDWNHRFYNMQQHSGEHIFSGIVHKRFGYDNVGFHLSDQIVTMDFNGPMTAEEIADVEYAVNEAIIRNVEIQVSYPSKEELAELSYRSKIDIEGHVRIVTIPGYDVCACCAPHVRRTGEIGLLKVMSVQNYKGGMRISILCGFRALIAFREKNAVISELMGTLTTGQDKLVVAVTKLRAINSQISAELMQARQMQLKQKLSEIPEGQEHVLLFDQGLDSGSMRNAVNELLKYHTGICGIWNGTDETGYNYIIGSADRDCRQIAAFLRSEFGSRGGGSARMIQGFVHANAADLKVQLLK